MNLALWILNIASETYTLPCLVLIEAQNDYDDFVHKGQSHKKDLLELIAYFIVSQSPKINVLSIKSECVMHVVSNSLCLQTYSTRNNLSPEN